MPQVRILARAAGNDDKRAVWLRYAGWLVAAIAVIRTFLTYFLDRDVELMRERTAA